MPDGYEPHEREINAALDAQVTIRTSVRNWISHPTSLGTPWKVITAALRAADATRDGGGQPISHGRVKDVRFRGHHVSGAPQEVKLTIILSWDECTQLMRGGVLPSEVDDDIMIALLAATSASESS